MLPQAIKHGYKGWQPLVHKATKRSQSSLQKIGVLIFFAYGINSRSRLNTHTIRIDRQSLRHPKPTAGQAICGGRSPMPRRSSLGTMLLKAIDFVLYVTAGLPAMLLNFPNETEAPH